jgi:hypothetical protein
MRRAGFFVLALVVWWGVAIFAAGLPRTLDDLLFSAAIIIFFGSPFGVPIVLYLACAEAYASTFRFASGIAVFLLLTLCGVVALLAVQHFWLGRPEDVLCAWADWDQLRQGPNLPSATVAALYLAKLIVQARGRASN